MKFGIDIDGTIVDTHRVAVEVYNRVLKKQVRIEDVEEFYLDKAYGLTREEGSKLWHELEEEIYNAGLPFPHSQEVLNRLIEEGHEVYYITARPGVTKVREITIAWLRKHGFPYTENNLHMDSYDKAKVALELGIDLFFEDAPRHLERLLEKGVPTVIVDAAYNRQYTSCRRIKNWREVYEILEEMETRL